MSPLFPYLPTLTAITHHSFKSNTFFFTNFLNVYTYLKVRSLHVSLISIFKQLFNYLSFPLAVVLWVLPHSPTGAEWIWVPVQDKRSEEEMVGPVWDGHVSLKHQITILSPPSCRPISKWFSLLSGIQKEKFCLAFFCAISIKKNQRFRILKKHKRFWKA